MRTELGDLLMFQSKALFVKDCQLDGGVVVECERCEYEQCDQSASGEPTFCLNCALELMYPSGASW